MIECLRGDLADHLHFSEMDLGLFSATWKSVADPHHFVILLK